MHTSHALVKLFIGRQCHLPVIVGAQTSCYAIPSGRLATIMDIYFTL